MRPPARLSAGGAKLKEVYMMTLSTYLRRSPKIPYNSPQPTIDCLVISPTLNSKTWSLVDQKGDVPVLNLAAGIPRRP